MVNAPKEIAHAVLLVNGAYVLQLRDDIPGIPARGMWSLFGGALEDGEPPEEGLRREISEELGLQLPVVHLFWQQDRYSEFWTRYPALLVLRRRRDLCLAVPCRQGRPGCPPVPFP